MLTEKTMVRLISDDGSSNIISENEAQIRANNLGLDLVVIDDRSDIPTVKILDFGKYQYDISKKKKASQKSQKATQIKIKEIQLRPVTGDNDIKIKAKSAKKFLNDGNQVKVTVRFRGREINNSEHGLQTMNKFLSFIEEYVPIQEVKTSGKEISTIISLK